MNALKKEILEGIRTYKFLVLSVGFIFYAFLDPLMLKVLPSILPSQAPGVDFSQLIAMGQKAAAANYMKSLSQIGVIVAAFSCMKITAGELREGTLALPFISGLKPAVWLKAKALVYGAALLLFTVAGMLANAAFAGSLFETDALDYLAVVKAGLWFGLYFDMLLFIEIFMGCLTKSPAVTAVSALAVCWLMPPVSGLAGIERYTPAMLLRDADALSPEFAPGLLPALITLGLLAALYCASICVIRRSELGRRQTP